MAVNSITRAATAGSDGSDGHARISRQFVVHLAGPHGTAALEGRPASIGRPGEVFMPRRRPAAIDCAIASAGLSGRPESGAGLAIARAAHAASENPRGPAPPPHPGTASVSARTPIGPPHRPVDPQLNPPRRDRTSRSALGRSLAATSRRSSGLHPSPPAPPQQQPWASPRGPGPAQDHPVVRHRCDDVVDRPARFAMTMAA